jgi:hypothetical protein
MARTIALVLAAIGGAFVYAAFLLKGMGMLSVPSLDASTYYLTVAFIAFVNAGLFASAYTAAEES